MSIDSMSVESRIDQAAQDGVLTSDSPSNLKSWLTRSCLSRYHERIREMIAADQWAELNALFWTAIPFGTGGRRGPMGEMGPATINDRTIVESAHGMAVYLRSTGVSSGGSAVIACDTRNNSRHFAKITACTFAAHGLKVFLFESPRSTPILSYAVRHLGCNIGVVISASHNPPADNGFKAYWSNGGQVIAPHDRGIIECVEAAEEIPNVDYEHAVRQGQIEVVGSDFDRLYIDEVANLSQSSTRDIAAVYTPLHGVGESNVFAVIQNLGFNRVLLFEPHRSPDGNFPNVPNHFPNPENLAVFDPVLQWIAADNVEADLILASDPDADRLGVMARNEDGEFVSLSGNQVGALLTDYLLRKRRQSGQFSPDDYVVETLVTTPLTRAVAEGHGARAFHELLVGFKFIAQIMEQQGTEHFVFGTEESIGFLAGGYCRDKDAAICAMFILELAAELKTDGGNLITQLDNLHRQHGYHCEGQTSIYCEGPTGKAEIDGLMTTLRSSPPPELGGINFTELMDYRRGTRLDVTTGQPSGTIDHPTGDLLFFLSDPEQSVRVQIGIRPSGTEPKIKFYLFCQSDLSGADGLEQARIIGNRILKDVDIALSQWAEQQLS
jgi:phosphoglucomutase